MVVYLYNRWQIISCLRNKEKQVMDPLLMKIKDDIGKQTVMDLEIGGDGI